MCSLNDVSRSKRCPRFFLCFFFVSGRTLFYLCIAIYLYGDLAIYAAAVAKSLRDVACTYKPANSSQFSNANITDDLPCWENSLFTRIDAYRYTRFYYLFYILCCLPVWLNLSLNNVWTSLSGAQNKAHIYVTVVWSNWTLSVPKSIHRCVSYQFWWVVRGEEARA